MKVLMVWDQGINYLLMRELTSLGVECRMIHSAEWDPFNMIAPEWKRDYRGHSKLWLGWDIVKASQWADIVHVHSFDKAVPALKTLRRRVVLHYHGTDIRGKWSEKRWLWGSADAILVSTRNLLEGAPPHAHYQPNPIDVEAFKPDPTAEPMHAVLYFNYGAVDLAERMAAEQGLPLVVVEKGVPYAEMPRILRGFTHYADVKRDDYGRLLVHKPDDTGSLVGLQALASGLTVLTLGGTRRGLPPEHHPTQVAQNILNIYEELMN